MSGAFLYTHDKYKEKEISKAVPFTKAYKYEYPWNKCYQGNKRLIQ